MAIFYLEDKSKMFHIIFVTLFYVLFPTYALAGANPDDPGGKIWWSNYEFGNNFDTWVMCICLVIVIGCIIVVQLDKKNKKDK